MKLNKERSSKLNEKERIQVQAPYPEYFYRYEGQGNQNPHYFMNPNTKQGYKPY